MKYTATIAVLATAIGLSLGRMAGWCSERQVIISAGTLIVVLAALVLSKRCATTEYRRSQRARQFKRAVLAGLIVAVLALAPSVGPQGTHSLAQILRDAWFDADRLWVENRWREFRRQGMWSDAVGLLENRLRRATSRAWRQRLSDYLHEALVSQAAVTGGQEAREFIEHARLSAHEVEVHPDLVDALEDRLKLGERLKELDGQLRQAHGARSLVEEQHQKQLDVLQQTLQQTEREARQAEVELRVRIGDQLGRQFDLRRRLYSEARGIARQHALDASAVDRAIARLEQEIAASRPIEIDPRVSVRLVHSELDAASLVRIVDFVLDAPASVSLPSLAGKDIEVISGQENVQALALGRFNRVAQRPQVVVLMDVSGSMKGERLDQAKQGVRQFLEVVSPVGEVTVYCFRNVVSRVVGWQSDTRVAFPAINALQAQGGTALLQAIESALRELAQRPGPRSIVVFTDGKDSIGGRHASELIHTAQQQQITIHAIGLQSAETDFALLQKLADATGGTFRAGDVSQLAAQFQQIAASLSLPAYRVIVPIADTSTGMLLRVGANGHELFLPSIDSAPAMARH